MSRSRPKMSRQNTRWTIRDEEAWRAGYKDGALDAMWLRMQDDYRDGPKRAIRGDASLLTEVASQMADEWAGDA